MNTFLFLLLSLVTVLFTMLSIAFESFSKIAMAGFLDDMENPRVKRFDILSKYEPLLNSLKAFSFLLQLVLVICAYNLFQLTINSPILRLGLVVLLALILFYLILYFLASTFRESVLKKLLFLIRLPWFVFYPLNMFFTRFSRISAEEKEADNDDLSEKELELFIEEGTKEGVIEEEDHEMIESILKFGDTLVKEIMTPRVDMVYINRDIDLNGLIKVINENKKSRYPVIADRIDNVIGIVHSKEVFDSLDHNRGDFNLKNILSEPFFVPETMRILELMKEMQRSKIKFAVVVDEFGGISGLVTMEDIIEEIVGEIQDEYDEDIQQIVQEGDNFIVEGNTDILELGEALDIKIEEDEDYQTVAGLISYRLGKIPTKGDSVLIHNRCFEVLEVEKNRIKKVIIRDGNE